MLNRMKYNNTNCVCCLSDEERRQMERSRQIDRDLLALKRRFRATQKIVLLGAGESGKSTFLKQMQLIHGKGFDHESKLSYRTQIYENVLKGMAGLINGKRELQLAWRGNISKEEAENANSTLIIVQTRMVQLLRSFSLFYRELMEEREAHSMRTSEQVHILPEQFSKCSSVLLEIWNDDTTREVYERRREIPKYFVENVPYFIQNLQKISKKDYLPDDDDILRSRRATTGINEIEMEIKTVPFRFVDVGGQRTQRQKWHLCFSDVTAILFLASSSEYDEYLREDGTTNRLEESCKVFDTLINYKVLKNVEFILFLNKHDLLKEKIQKINLKTYCHDFSGNPHSINDVEKYLVRKFTHLKKSMPATQRAEFRQQEQQTLSPRHSNFIQDFDSIQMDSHEEKSIYSHFTTAIDTNNIKTIFEMVRLMIFEKNCKAIMLS